MTRYFFTQKGKKFLNGISGGTSAASAAPAFTIPLPQVTVEQELPDGKLVAVLCKRLKTCEGVMEGL